MPPFDTFRAAFSDWNSPEHPTDLNPRPAVPERFMNFDVRVGTKVERTELAVVLNGSAGRAAFESEPHGERLSVDTPDSASIDAALEGGSLPYVR